MVYGAAWGCVSNGILSVYPPNHTCIVANALTMYIVSFFSMLPSQVTPFPAPGTAAAIVGALQLGQITEKVCNLSNIHSSKIT